MADNNSIVIDFSDLESDLEKIFKGFISKYKTHEEKASEEAENNRPKKEQTQEFSNSLKERVDSVEAVQDCLIEDINYLKSSQENLVHLIERFVDASIEYLKNNYYDEEEDDDEDYESEEDECDCDCGCHENLYVGPCPFKEDDEEGDEEEEDSEDGEDILMSLVQGFMKSLDDALEDTCEEDCEEENDNKGSDINNILLDFAKNINDKGINEPFVVVYTGKNKFYVGLNR